MSEGNPVEKAIRESAAHVASARAATRTRNLWFYLRATELEKWARSRGLVGDTDQLMRKYFENAIKDDPATAPVVTGTDENGIVMHAVYVGIAWCVVCPDGNQRRTIAIQDLELAKKAVTAPCTEIDLDADTQVPCPGGEHRLEKLPPLTDPVF